MHLLFSSASSWKPTMALTLLYAHLCSQSLEAESVSINVSTQGSWLKLWDTIGACRPGHTRVVFRIMRILISRGRDAKTHGHQHSVKCSDKISFLQLCIECGVAKSYPGTYTALQAPNMWDTTLDYEAEGTQHAPCTVR